MAKLKKYGDVQLHFLVLQQMMGLPIMQLRIGCLHLTPGRISAAIIT